MHKDDYCKMFGRDMALAGAQEFLENPQGWHNNWCILTQNYIRMTQHQLALNGKHWGGKRAAKAIQKNQNWSPYSTRHKNLAMKSAEETFEVLTKLMQKAIDLNIGS